MDCSSVANLAAGDLAWGCVGVYGLTTAVRLESVLPLSSGVEPSVGSEAQLQAIAPRLDGKASGQPVISAKFTVHTKQLDGAVKGGKSAYSIATAMTDFFIGAAGFRGLLSEVQLQELTRAGKCIHLP